MRDNVLIIYKMLTKSSRSVLKSVLLSPCRIANRSCAQSSAGQFTKNDIPHTYTHPYFTLYPWKSLDDFARILHQNKVYEDENFIVVDKPWGVGIHEVYPKIHKKNADIIDWASTFGDPRFCLDQVMPLLQEKFRCPNLFIARALDRYESGLVLLGKQQESTRILRECSLRSRRGKNCYLYYLAICRGTPNIQGKFVKENVVVRMKELDELGDHKQPVIEYNVSKSAIQKFDLMKASVSMQILDSNRQTATSIVEIGTSEIRKRTVRAYAASKASFILGDVVFASRVKQILGVPISITPTRPGYDGYEPLHQKVRSRLSIPSNRSIPLLYHFHRIILQGNKKVPTIEIQCSELPRHFTWTMEQLDLHFNRDDENMPGEKT